MCFPSEKPTLFGRVTKIVRFLRDLRLYAKESNMPTLLLSFIVTFVCMDIICGIFVFSSYIRCSVEIDCMGL